MKEATILKVTFMKLISTNAEGLIKLTEAATTAFLSFSDAYIELNKAFITGTFPLEIKLTKSTLDFKNAAAVIYKDANNTGKVNIDQSTIKSIDGITAIVSNDITLTSITVD
jgi:hypothetical protein